MYKSEINILLYGSQDQQSQITALCQGDPAISFHNYLERNENVTISDIEEILYTNHGYLTLGEMYFRISQGDLTEAEMKAIADLLGVDVSAIWRDK